MHVKFVTSVNLQLLQESKIGCVDEGEVNNTYMYEYFRYKCTLPSAQDNNVNLLWYFKK